MKISLRWLFDHCNGNWHEIDVAALVKLFNQKVAEIERWYKINTDINELTLVEARQLHPTMIVAHSPEWNEDATLPMRSDVVTGNWYLAIKKNGVLAWATSDDLGGEKGVLLPALFVESGEQAGGWKKWFEVEDYILEVDNKSITHRPDLWGHRGFAREVAALLGTTLKPLDDFLADLPIQDYQKKSPAAHGSPFTVSVETDYCKRFATLYLHQVTNRASLLWMATRLSRVDSRCIDAIVDTTNYVMQDLSQPMHAFDAQKLKTKAIAVCMASNKAELTLLDGQKIKLTDHDMIIADGATPLSLAGIMGGVSSAINSATTSVLLESASFDAATIRKSSVHHKLRTEASARFEKSLDPNQNGDALRRFIFLIRDAQMSFACSGAIMSIGEQIKPMGIAITHAFIEERLGTTVATGFVVKTLEQLGFTVDQYNKDGAVSYRVTAPSYRSTKDISLPEDIVEEVGRFFGYDTIEPRMPLLPLNPKNMHAVQQLQLIKQTVAFVLQMHEVHNYAFYDESLLRELGFEPTNAVGIKNPVSENAKRLVTSLIPHLLKSVQQNHADYDELRFFECARVWEGHETVIECKKIAGIFFDAKKEIDFYTVKAELSKLCAVLRLPVSYEPVTEPGAPWFTKSLSAHLVHDGNKVGTMGIVPTSFLSKVCQGYACVFELDGDFLESYYPTPILVHPLPKYPLVTRDISLMVPLAVTVRELSTLIKGADRTIVSVDLVDFFTKKEWGNQKALTFRYVCRNDHKTMEKEEIERIERAVRLAAERAGGTVR